MPLPWLCTPHNINYDRRTSIDWFHNLDWLNLGAIMCYLAGKRIPYLTITPKHHSGNKYTFQFQGSGGFDLKQRVNESWWNETALQNIATTKQRLQFHDKQQNKATTTPMRYIKPAQLQSFTPSINISKPQDQKK